MKVVSELDLAYLPVEAAEFSADPMRFADVARRKHPWLARFREGYLVHGYQANTDLLTNFDALQPGLFGLSEFYDAQSTTWAEFMEGTINSTTGDLHLRLRDSVKEAFTPRRANALRSLMRETMSQLLDGWNGRGAFDFVEFSTYYPITVMCGLLGISPDRIPYIREALDHQVASLSLNRELKSTFMASFDVLWSYAGEVIAERERTGPKGDGSELDAFIAARNRGELNETELRIMLLTFVTAGYDTSRNMLSMAMYTLLNHPEILERCGTDRDYCSKVLQEVFRYSSIATILRTAVKDFEYADVWFPKDTLLALAIPLSGRDPAMFPEPHRFDPQRQNAARHAAFGRGPHICIGMFMARAQLEEGLHLIAQRLKNPRLNGEAKWRPFISVWGLQSLPIAFDTAPGG